MLRTALQITAGLSLLAAPLSGQDYSGTYAATNGQGGQTVMTLRQGTNGQVTGTISGSGTTLEIQGALEEGSVVGAMKGAQGGLWFEAELDDGDLHVTLVEPDANGQPNYSTASTIILSRASTVAQEATSGSNPLAGAQQQGAANQGYGGQAMAGVGGGSLHDGTQVGQEWAEFLVNKKATQMDSYSSGSAGGYSSRTDVHFCANGQFALSGNSMVSADVGGVSGYNGGNSQGSGTWRVITEGQVAGIELRYSNGGVEQYRLDYQDGATYVNGDRWYITPSEACGY